MAVSDKSALSVHFKHNAGLSLQQMGDLQDWLQAFYTVRFRHYRPTQECTIVQRMGLLRKIADFVVWLRFLTEAKISPKDMAPFYFMHKGRLLSAAKWLPMVVKRRHYLLSEESNSPYWRYLDQGYTTFKTSRKGCIAEFRDIRYVKQKFQVWPKYFALDIRRRFNNQEIPLPPYHLVKDLNNTQWENFFGTDYTVVKKTIEERRRRDYALSPTENVRLGMIIANGRTIRDEPYSIQEVLIKLAEGEYRNDVEQELNDYNEDLDRHRRATRASVVIHKMMRNSTIKTRDPVKHLQEVLLEKIHEETGMNVSVEELHGWIQDGGDNPVRRSLIPFELQVNDTLKPLHRKKRFVSAIVSLTMRAIPQMQRVFGLLWKATKHWFNKIVGNPITTRTLAIAHKTVAKADKAGNVIKKKVATFVTRARNSRQKRALMERFGPFATASLKYTKDAGNKFSTPLKATFTKTRAGHLRLPSTLPTRFQDLYGNKAVMHLRNRLFRGWQYARNHKLATTFNIAGIALLGYGIGDIVEKATYEKKIDFCEGGDLSDFSCSNDTLATRPLLKAAIQNYNGILKPAFLYNIERNSNVSIADQYSQLQREVLGQFGMVNVTDDVTDVVQASLDQLEEAYREDHQINIFDREIDLRERQRHLKAIRNGNAVSKYHKSYEFAHLLYPQKSNIHKKAMEAFEIFIGLQSYSHRTLQADERFQDELVKNYCKNLISKEEFVAEIESYFFLVYKQLREQYSRYLKKGYDVAAPSSMDGLEGQSPQLDLIGLKSNDHRVFRTLTRRRGQEELNAQDKEMDLILALDEERRFWNDNFQTHRLLIKTLSFDVPPDPLDSDYIQSMLWYQIYLARPDIRRHVEYFMTKTSKLLLIRLFMENRAVNMSTAALEQQMDAIDLEELQHDPETYVIDAVALKQAIDNTEHYDILRDPNQVITDYAATPEELAENPEIIKMAFGSQVNETTNTATTRDQILRRVRRSATQIFETLTNTTLYQQDVAKMISDRDHLDLITARHRLHLEHGNLSMHNLMLLQEEIKKIRLMENEGSTETEIKEAHQLFFINVLKYLDKEQYPDLGMLSMILTPEQIETLRVQRRDIGEKLLSTQIMGQLQQIGSLQQRNAILAFMKKEQEIRLKMKLENELKYWKTQLESHKEIFRGKRHHWNKEVLKTAEADPDGFNEAYSRTFCGNTDLERSINSGTLNMLQLFDALCWENHPMQQAQMCVALATFVAAVAIGSLFIQTVFNAVVTGAAPPHSENSLAGHTENEAEEEPRLLDNHENN